MTSLFAIFLLLSLAACAAVAFANEKLRPKLKWVLITALACAWIFLGAAIVELLARTSNTLITPGGARQPHLLDPALRQGLMLFVSLGGPAILATALGIFALRTRRPGARPPRASKQ